jgi:hypothetical protein
MRDFNFDIPVIDNRNDELLLQQAIGTASNASRGALNDFSENGPLFALLQAQVFSTGELLYHTNKLPEVAVYELMKLLGVERRVGTFARVTIEFRLNQSRTQQFVINSGFELRSRNNLKFYTDSLLVIPPGNLTGTVTATAELEGSSHNVDAFTITNFTQRLSGLQSVTNPQQATGGSDEEPLKDYIDRVLTSIRVRNPVTAGDFERLAEGIMGPGSRAKAIPTMDGDRRLNIPGAFHVFCLAEEGVPANDALISEVGVRLQNDTYIGTTAYVSPMELRDVTVSVVARLSQAENPTIVADRIFNSFRSYLSPTNFNPGDAILIQELAFRIRQTQGLDFIDDFFLNGENKNIALLDFELPFAKSMQITLVDSNSQVFETARGDLDELE